MAILCNGSTQPSSAKYVSHWSLAENKGNLLAVFDVQSIQKKFCARKRVQITCPQSRLLLLLFERKTLPYLGFGSPCS